MGRTGPFPGGSGWAPTIRAVESRADGGSDQIHRFRCRAASGHSENEWAKTVSDPRPDRPRAWFAAQTFMRIAMFVHDKVRSARTLRSITGASRNGSRAAIPWAAQVVSP